MRRASLDSQGFTLMEIMVSVLVLAIALTMIMQLLSGGLRSEKLSEDYLKATACGRSGMESILLEKTLATGNMTGSCAGGYRWQAAISPAGEFERPTTGQQSGPRPFRINLEVLWQSGRSTRSLRLATIQLAQATPEGDHAK